jgi:hypothetical protein
MEAIPSSFNSLPKKYVGINSKVVLGFVKQAFTLWIAMYLVKGFHFWGTPRYSDCGYGI